MQETGNVRQSNIAKEKQDAQVGKPCGYFWSYCRWKSAAVILIVTFLAMIVYSCTHTKSEILLMENNVQEEDVSAEKIRYKHTNRRLPQAIIIGARKGGTRALLVFLNLHPQIMTAKKEVHFFDDDEAYPLGPEWYRKKMPYTFPGQLTIEKTPAYFVTDTVPMRIFQMNSTIKLLLVVRDPVERAISDYLQLFYKAGGEHGHIGTFEDMVLKDNGGIDVSYGPVKRSIYYRYLSRWLEVFPLKQIFIINGKDLVENPYHQMTQIETFLGLEKRITPNMFYYNESKGFYCIHTDEIEKCLRDSKGREHPYVSPVVIHKLRKFYAPFNQKLYDLTGHNYGWLET